jgi:hypothetical protein
MKAIRSKELVSQAYLEFKLKEQAEAYIKNIDELINEIEIYETKNSDNGWTDMVLGILFTLRKKCLGDEE